MVMPPLPLLPLPTFKLYHYEHATRYTCNCKPIFQLWDSFPWISFQHGGRPAFCQGRCLVPFFAQSPTYCTSRLHPYKLTNVLDFPPGLITLTRRDARYPLHAPSRCLPHEPSKTMPNLPWITHPTLTFANGVRAVSGSQLTLGPQFPHKNRLTRRELKHLKPLDHVRSYSLHTHKAFHSSQPFTH
jgi:hypothetical protein